MGRKKRHDAAAGHADDSVPFGFLLGEQYAGYYQVLNSSKDLKPMPSSLPKLFWGLSNEQRRLLATRMLEAGHGHSGDELKQAIRTATLGEESNQRRKRAPVGSRLSHNARKGGDGVTIGIAGNGRPVSPERYRPREPFMSVESEEVYTYGSGGGRAERARERADCAPARRRREVQELMRARVQVQEDYLAGLELDRREWRQYKTRTIKSHMVASKRQLLEARLKYGSDSPDGDGSDMMSFAPDHEKNRLAKQELSRSLKAARQLELQANVDGALMRRWEKTIVKSIKSEKRPLHWNAPASPLGSDCIVGGDPDLVRAIRSLEEDYVACQETPTATPEKPGVKGTTMKQPPTAVLSVEPDAIPDLELGQALGHAAGQASVGECEPSRSVRPELDGAPDDAAAVGALEPASSEHAVRARDECSQLPHEKNNLLYELPAVGVSETAMPEHEGEAVQGVEVGRVQSVGSAGSSSTEEERIKVKTMVEKLLRTSNSVALAAARPLTIKPPPVLMVETDTRRAQLACRVRSCRQPLPLRPRSHSERSFIGGGFRTTRSTAALPTRSGTAGPAVPPPPYRALPSGSSKVLDLEAISVAGCGAGTASTEKTTHLRNRYARMSSNEVERFLRSWGSTNDNRNGSPEGEGHGGGKWRSGAAGLDVDLGVLGVNADDGGAEKVTVATAATMSGGSEGMGNRKTVFVPGGLLLPPGVGCFVRGSSLLDTPAGKSTEP